jgi:hypothetical protein
MFQGVAEPTNSFVSPPLLTTGSHHGVVNPSASKPYAIGRTTSPTVRMTTPSSRLGVERYAKAWCSIFYCDHLDSQVVPLKCSCEEA